MEMDQQPPRSITEVLRRGIARLQSVAVVHDMLQARDLRFVDIKQAARRIVQLTCQTAAPGTEIEARVSGARVMLPSQQATNIAMILSELVDNAVRHGLPKVQDGRILVNLAEGGGNVVIEVNDNGAGLPAGFDLERDSGLGLKVVRGIVEEELGGFLDIESNGGLTVRARFPKHQ
jgi:two-component sensor histidine kinase